MQKLQKLFLLPLLLISIIVNAQTRTVKGKVVVKDLLTLRGKAVITGNIQAVKLQIEPTVTFNGQCHMNGSSSAKEEKGKAAIFEMSTDSARAVGE